MIWKQRTTNWFKCTTTFGMINHSVPWIARRYWYQNVTTQNLHANELKLGLWLALSPIGRTKTYGKIYKNRHTICRDIENIVYKIYQHFSIYTLRTEKLREFCDYIWRTIQGSPLPLKNSLAVVGSVYGTDPSFVWRFAVVFPQQRKRSVGNIIFFLNASSEFWLLFIRICKTSCSQDYHSQRNKN